MLKIFWLSSSPVAEPKTREKRSDEYSLKPSSTGTKAFEKGIRSGLARMRGAPIFQKKWDDGEIRMTLYVVEFLLLDSRAGIVWRRR